MVAMTGACLAFLQYNFNPAKIFMGDTGSMFLGYIIAAVSVMGSMKTAAAAVLIVPLVALAVPITDTLLAIVRRAAAFRFSRRIRTTCITGSLPRASIRSRSSSSCTH